MIKYLSSVVRSIFFWTVPFLFVLTQLDFSSAQGKNNQPQFGMVIHGGAGTILKENMTTELEVAYKTKLKEALSVGYDILKNGGRSLDAVEATIRVMEDSPLFNAGKGAVFTSDASHELDAAIMDGATLQAGSIARVKHIKNPISLARLVLEKSPHVMLVGDGVEAFATQHHVETVSQYYFYTEKRWQQLQLRKEAEAKKTTSREFMPEEKTKKITDKIKGTVGAVALDKAGNLAAGTSTGGLSNKLYGRVGDSPIIGAGTYANNQTCAVSATGAGEYFMRLLVAYDIHALMAYQNKSLQEAANTVVMDKLVHLGGTGGIIAIDKNGNMAMPFNTKGMYRGFVDRSGQIVVKI
ncbi:MAG: isoaspartyl peptidase/L-asparaginase family protein, partial [bacterium]